MRQNALQHWLTAMVMLMLTTAVAAQNNINTTVNTDEITHGDTITMTVEVIGRQGNVPIDITSLEEDFDVVSTRTSSQLRNINGRVQSRTRYELMLFPRQAGAQTIPPIEIGGYSSDPIPITVNARERNAQRDEDLYMETSISTDDVYVQEELLFTIRLFFRLDGIRNPNFTTLDMDNTVIQQLGPPNQYEQIVDGQRYGVYELNYAIFPQRSGELVIPDIFFRAQLTDGSSRSIFRNNAVETITAFAPGYQVAVRPRPESYPEDATWLPARSLEIREEWDRDITGLQPGDTAERTITIRADGLDGAAIPPINMEDIQRASLYPEAADIERAIIDGKVVGTRTRTWALVPTEPGSVVVPEIRIPWWNTEEDRLEYAVVSESFITVRDPAARNASEASLSSQDDSGTDPAALLDTADDLVTSPTTPAWIFTLMMAVLIAAAAFMAITYRRKQTLVTAAAGHPAVAPTSAAYRREMTELDEIQSYHELMQRCRQGTPGAIRLALIAWARQYYNDPQLLTLDGLTYRTGDDRLTAYCHQLQQALYAADNAADLSRETREGLADYITGWRERHRRDQRHHDRTRRYELPPLYRN